MAVARSDQLLPWEGNGGVGICLSGGGIRAAAFALGAVQGLQEERGLLFGPRAADHLAVVSGGSYLGAAFMLNAAVLAQRASGELPPLAERSPEADHIVATGDYLGHGGFLWTLTRWLTADVLNFAAFLAIAIWTGTMLATYAWLVHRYVHVPIAHDDWQWPIAVVVIIGGGLVFRGLYKDGGPARRAMPILGFVLLAVAAPTFEALVQRYPPTSHAGWWWNWGHLWPIFAATAAIAVVWFVVRHRSEAHAVSEVSVMIPRFAGLVLLAVTTASAFASITHGLSNQATTSDAASSAGRYFGILIAGVVFSWIAARVSLHRLYRDQLSWCFSIRRRDGGGVDEVGSTATKLSDLAPPAHGTEKSFPRLLISATANVVVRGPDGRRRGFAPFIMSHDRCGIPGSPGASLDTSFLETIAAPAGIAGGTEPLLSLMSGVASTGAAVSPSMGARTVRAARSFIAILNIRLGRWFPNPLSAYIRDELANAQSTGRRIKWASWHRGIAEGYDEFLPELFGLHQPDAPRLYVSDGGHFDNLGLLALLRARCTEVWCVDSQADKNGHASQLRHVLALAQSELAVTIGLDPDVFAGEDGVLATAHAVGTIEYPEGTVGTLVVIKLGLTPDSPKDLKDRRRTDRFFPHHPTFPFQVFRPDRMDAYRRLGLLNATAAALAAPRPTPSIPRAR